MPKQKLSDSKIKKGEKGVWQRRYWEHTIRNETDLYKHLDYIHFNPIKYYNIKPKNEIFHLFTNLLIKVFMINIGEFLTINIKLMNYITINYY
mgnify:CR=1 FL=1